ncbi:MAG TPA: CoA pyrophosphatase [Thermodesulfobacteriota bacterium]|nr:CoA pyrophosphatase [Deltaproteobacteria bacterium]HNR13024.1 CoA pyrophosphatase [Thermodesulfobacteriota bacterium]HNU72918.1 CoA pyrophosphatase [Thermodesulfobacteriota bacterium]HOC39204.1 CoA pyrophosphatase [Thermodesulfobacteriota bacterium]HQO77213.1 CoA pyrophosphatase [Thermodesulfobacteriota bacterium]
MALLPDQYRTLLAHRRRTVIEDQSLIPSAVLLLLYEKKGEPHILLTKRTNKVAAHKGQISFPGGVREATDRSLIATALREACEEVGVDSRTVEVLGYLDDCPTASTNYLITPVVGFISYIPAVRISPDEVEEVLEVPIAGLQKAAPSSVTIVDAPTLPDDPQYLYGDHIIWGATARILEQFLSLNNAAR